MGVERIFSRGGNRGFFKAEAMRVFIWGGNSGFFDFFMGGDSGKISFDQL